MKLGTTKNILFTFVASFISTGMLHAGVYEERLISAAINNKVDAAALAIQRGANIDYKDEQNVTPLMHATLHGSQDVVAFLLSKRPSLNTINAYNTTALMLACMYGRLTIVDLLLTSGASISVNLTTSTGHSALTCAANNEDLKLVCLLLGHKAIATTQTLTKIKWWHNEHLTDKQKAIYDAICDAMEALALPKLKSNL